MTLKQLTKGSTILLFAVVVGLGVTATAYGAPVFQLGGDPNAPPVVPKKTSFLKKLKHGLGKAYHAYASYLLDTQTVPVRTVN